MKVAFTNQRLFIRCDDAIGKCFDCVDRLLQRSEGVIKRVWQTAFSLGYGDIRVAAVTYALIPVVLFLTCFLKWYFALFGLVAIGFGYRDILKNKRKNTLRTKTINLRVSTMVIIFFVALLWCQLGGLNGYLYQTADWDCRNAIFRDLITHRWPVVYESSNSALVYYVGHWLPAALIAKVVEALFHSASLTWFVGRMALWVWTALGISLIVLLLFVFVNAKSTKKRVIAMMVFIFFSGLDCIGMVITHKTRYLLSPELLHLEWWPMEAYQYTSITACLYWVFNQSVIPWLLTLCFLMDEDERNYVTYGVACVICGPLPLIGLAVLMVARAACRFVTCICKRQVRDWFKAVFSPGNILILILIMPLFVLYLFGNNAISATINSEFFADQTAFFSASYWNRDLIVFFILEVGIYLLLIWNKHKKDPLYYIIVVSLLCIPYFHVGMRTDFCTRVSLPGIFIIMAYVAEYLATFFSLPKRKRKSVKASKRICATALLVVFLLGAVTPLVEIGRGIYKVIDARDLVMPCDTIITFDNGTVTTNFSTSDVGQKLFYKYIAR